jgi:hypothetical protein
MVLPHDTMPRPADDDDTAAGFVDALEDSQVSTPETRAKVVFADAAVAAGRVPLAWVRPTAAAPFPNLGDALSPVIVGAVSGMAIEPRDFDDRRSRLVAVGTIAHAQRNGEVHMWGTGLDATGYALPADTRLDVHAMRGPRSADVLRRLGVDVPPIYGDPVWFLPRILPRRPAPPQAELGVIVHISELDRADPRAPLLSDFIRYDVPAELGGAIRIINTFTANSFRGLFDKVDEMLACRRIASTSFHGLLIAEAYGIPCVWFGPRPGGAMSIDPHNPAIEADHRFLDFFAGTAAKRMRAFCQPREERTHWDKLIRWIDRAWQPLEYDPEPLLSAFPLPASVSLEAPLWPLLGRSVQTMLA